MKKTLLSAALASAVLVSSNASASALDGVGLGLNYGLISGPGLELNYPINDTFQVRGAISNGMGLSTTTDDTDVKYDLKADGGVHRLAIDYHPFQGTFFLSGGYAVNNFKLDASANVANGEVVKIGDKEYTSTGNLKLKGALEWDSAPTLSLGWGHSPSSGWGAMFEVGAIFTGAAKVSLVGTGKVKEGTNPSVDVSSDPEVQASIDREKKKLQDDVAKLKFLPILQAGITYRF